MCSDGGFVQIDRLSLNQYRLRGIAVKFIVIPASIKIFAVGLFEISPIELAPFESRSQLTRIEQKALKGCNSLRSIYIPSSVEILCIRCFDGCRHLSAVFYESGSKLLRIERSAFSLCSSLTSLFLPACVRHIDVKAFANRNISSITIEDGNCHFRVVGPFLLDYAGWCLLQFFGRDSHVTIDQSIFGTSRFFPSAPPCALSFDFNSRYRRIGQMAFEKCESLRSITIPGSVENSRVIVFFFLRIPFESIL
jgi:hypothetical protein